MVETRWAVVSKADRAGQRLCGWPVAALDVLATKDGAEWRLDLMHHAGHTNIEVVEVKLRDCDWPLWIQVGSDVSG